jgi:hypothetical protein
MPAFATRHRSNRTLNREFRNFLRRLNLTYVAIDQREVIGSETPSIRAPARSDNIVFARRNALTTPAPMPCDAHETILSSDFTIRLD